MDHLLWKNINDLGEHPQVIDENTTVDHFNQIYHGQSLFHYFVQKSEVIEVIHDKYMGLLENGNLTKDQKFIPLVMLLPDNDGKTALELSIEKHCPRTFELMLNLLAQFNEFCFSRMMLTVLPNML